MNSNIVKPEKFGHLHLAYHFTVPLTGRDKGNDLTDNDFDKLEFILNSIKD